MANYMKFWCSHCNNFHEAGWCSSNTL